MIGTWGQAFFARAKSPSTAEKHAVLGAAFAAFLDETPDAATPHTIFDGFAGAGVFGDGTLGSPLLLLNWARERAPARSLRFVFSEADAKNHAQLGAALGERGGVSIHLRHTTFELAAASLLAEPEGALFSFVDPYAYEGMRFATLAALAARGTLVLHLASKALYTKLISSNGAGLRQERRMDALLGGAATWAELGEVVRRAPGDAPGAKAAIADVLRRSLEAVGSECEVQAVRGGESHVLVARRG